MFKYIKYADMLKQIIQKKKQLKQVIYKDQKAKNQNNSQHSGNVNISAAYSLLSLIVNNYGKLQQFIEKIQIRTNSTIKNSFLLIVMTGQFINLGKIKGGGKIKKIILQNIDLLPQIKKQSKINKQTVQIRLIQISLSQQNSSIRKKSIGNNQQKIDQFQQWKRVFQTQNDFQKNNIVKNLYNLNALDYQKLIQKYPNILNSSTVVIQSFSSALPPYLLLHGVQKSNLKKFNIIDACSAPGNKTIQLEQYSFHPELRRKVIAFQKDSRRFDILNRTIERYNIHKNIQSFNQNFLETNPSENRFKSVKFILLDPSCSGSGMLSNFLRDNTEEKDENYNNMNFQEFCDYSYKKLENKQKERVENLHNFQIKLLSHTAKFKPKRISYSTCSIYQRQNQDVVRQFLANNSEYVLKQNKLITRNIGKYSICQGFDEFKNCVRVDPRTRETDGFFVAIFSRKKEF